LIVEVLELHTSGGVTLPSPKELFTKGILELGERQVHWPRLILLGVLGVAADLVIRRIRGIELR
jgi:hypothetical protein